MTAGHTPTRLVALGNISSTQSPSWAALRVAGDGNLLLYTPRGKNMLEVFLPPPATRVSCLAKGHAKLG